jgi:DNA-binding CsgD family transcriptional regulator
MDAPTSHPLTAREREVIILIVSGLSSKEVGHRLGIACRTAAIHRYNAMRKLRVKNATDLARATIRLGLIDPEAQTPVWRGLLP